MKNLIQLKNIHKAFTHSVLFDSETFSVNEGEHIGLIGPNGAGKTTLFKILIGEQELDSGDIISSRHLRLGYLPQHDLWNKSDTIESYLEQKCQMPIWELKKIAKGLGLSDEDFNKPVASFSGGYRMRVKLLAMIGEEPNLMLLDEPTNYLDLETILVLEQFLKSYEGAFILISHDRNFLRKTADKIIEVESGKIRKVDAGLDKFLEYKQIIIEEAKRQAKKVADEKQEIIEFANRFRSKASKAKQVQSRLKRLDKLKEVELIASYVAANIQLPRPIHTGKQIINIEKGEFGYGDKTVLKDVNINILRGDHCGIVGFNGAGKSTLLKGLVKELEPFSGEVKHGYAVKIGYYAQHIIEHLNLNHTIIESIDSVAHPSITLQDVLDIAGSLMFSGPDAKKKLKVLSGGELARVTLGRVLVQKAPCLILDEPTNHLDFETVAALAEALKSYEGTVIVVSHDRDFIAKVSDKILEIRDGHVIPFAGNYEEYVWSLTNGVLSEFITESMPEPTKEASLKQKSQSVVGKKNQKEARKKIRKLEKELSSVEARMERTQAEINELTNQLTDAGNQQLATVTGKITDLQNKFSADEQVWESAMSEKEKCEQNLS